MEIITDMTFNWQPATAHWFAQEVHQTQLLLPFGSRTLHNSMSFVARERLLYKINKALYPDTQFAFSDGEPEEVLDLTEQDVIDYKNRFYTPRNAAIILYGPCDDGVFEYLDAIGKSIRRFASQNAEYEQPTILPTIQSPFPAEPSTIFEPGFDNSTHVGIGFALDVPREELTKVKNYKTFQQSFLTSIFASSQCSSFTWSPSHPKMITYP
eukprot:Selendium_serpulae@DN736_c0_g1_i1.p1